MIGLTILILGFAWYQKLKPRKKDEIACECEEDKKTSFWKSKKFLLILTILAGLLITFPYYSKIFFPSFTKNAMKNTMVAKQKKITYAIITIEGMTCTGCEQSVNKAFTDLPGVLEASSDYNTGIAKIKYDKSKVGEADFKKAIEQTLGYKVIDIKRGE